MTKFDFDQLTSGNENSDITAKDIMDKDAQTAKADYTIKSCIEILKVNKVPSLPIVDENNGLIGVISEADLLIQAGFKDLSGPIEFKHDVKTASPEDTLKELLIFMVKNRLKRVPIVDNRVKLLGVVSRIDILNALTKL